MENTLQLNQIGIKWFVNGLKWTLTNKPCTYVHLKHGCRENDSRFEFDYQVPKFDGQRSYGQSRLAFKEHVRTSVCPFVVVASIQGLRRPKSETTLYIMTKW